MGAKIRKIAVLRANAIGDFVFALPALEALRNSFPEAEIVLLGRQWHASFLTDRPGPVDRVVVVPGPFGLEREAIGEEKATLDVFFKRMQQEQFDLAVQIYGGGRFSNSFVLRLGAQKTIGLKTPDALPLDLWVPYVYFQSEYLRYLEVVRLVGAYPTDTQPHLQVTARDLAEVKETLPRIEKPLICIHVGAGDARRRWPAEKFAELSDFLAGEGYQIAVVGTEQDEEEIDRVIGGMKSMPINLCSRLSLGGLAGLASQCRLFISNDSGPMHVAIAVGAPVVGIFWCGNLINAGPAYRSHFRPVISWRMNCPECGQDTMLNPCNHAVSFVGDIKVEDILEAAHDLLENL